MRISKKKRQAELRRLDARESRLRSDLQGVKPLSEEASRIHSELHSIALERWRLDPRGVEHKSRPGPIDKEALKYMREKKLASEVDARARHMYQRRGGRKPWRSLPAQTRRKWRDAARREVWGDEHRHTFAVAGIWRADLLKDVRAAAQAAIERGDTFQTFQKQLRPEIESKGWSPSGNRLRTIYSTNLRVARAAGQWTRIQRSKRALPYLLYQAGPSADHDRSPDESHTPFFGQVRLASDWGGMYPPNGFGCKCWMRQVGRREAEAYGLSDGALPNLASPGWDYNPGDPSSIPSRSRP